MEKYSEEYFGDEEEPQTKDFFVYQTRTYRMSLQAVDEAHVKSLLRIGTLEPWELLDESYYRIEESEDY